MKIRFKNLCLTWCLLFSLILLPYQILLAFSQENETEITSQERKIPEGSEKKLTPPKSDESDLLLDTWGFLKILVAVIVIIGIVGWVVYFYYEIKFKEIKRIDMAIRKLKKMVEEEKTSRELSFVRREITEKKRIEDDPYFSQEIPKIYQKIKSIEGEFNTYAGEHRKMGEELHRQQKISYLLEDILKREISVFREFVSCRESLFGDIEKIQKGVSLFEERGIRRLEGERQTSPTNESIKKPITEKNLIEWWNEFGKQRLSICRETLAERFSDVKSEVILNGRYPDEWKVIGISKTSDNLYYVVPFKGGRWWTDYSKSISDYKKWFELEEEKEDMTLTIGSIILPLPKARKVISEWELIGSKGRVSIKESQ